MVERADAALSHGPATHLPSVGRHKEMNVEWIKGFLVWATTAPLLLRILLFLAVTGSAGWYLFIYKPSPKRIAITEEALRARIVLVDQVTRDYILVESQIWKAKGHLAGHSMTRNEIVNYLQPLTRRAADIRTSNRARQVEMGRLSLLTRGLDANVILCLAQLIWTYMPEEEKAHHGPISGPTLDETIAEINDRIEHIAFSRSVYQKITERGVDSLSDDEYAMYLWLIGEGALTDETPDNEESLAPSDQPPLSPDGRLRRPRGEASRR